MSRATLLILACLVVNVLSDEGNSTNTTAPQPSRCGGRLIPGCGPGLVYCEPDEINGVPWYRCHDNQVRTDFLNRLLKPLEGAGPTGIPLNPALLASLGQQLLLQQQYSHPPYWPPYLQQPYLPPYTHPQYPPPYQRPPLQIPYENGQSGLSYQDTYLLQRTNYNPLLNYPPPPQYPPLPNPNPINPYVGHSDLLSHLINSYLPPKPNPSQPPNLPGPYGNSLPLQNLLPPLQEPIPPLQPPFPPLQPPIPPFGGSPGPYISYPSHLNSYTNVQMPSPISLPWPRPPYDPQGVIYGTRDDQTRLIKIPLRTDNIRSDVSSIPLEFNPGINPPINNIYPPPPVDFYPPPPPPSFPPPPPPPFLPPPLPYPSPVIPYNNFNPDVPIPVPFLPPPIVKWIPVIVC